MSYGTNVSVSICCQIGGWRGSYQVSVVGPCLRYVDESGDLEKAAEASGVRRGTIVEVEDCEGAEDPVDLLCVDDDCGFRVRRRVDVVLEALQNGVLFGG